MVEDFRKVGERIRNWGRWGDDDEKGTVNLITPECVGAAGQLVQAGRDLRPRHPVRRQRPAARRRAHQPGPADVGDRARTRSSRAPSTTPTTSCSCRCRRRRSGTGWPTSSTTTSCTTASRRATSSPHGAMHCSIDKMAKGIVGRGVLLDIARLKGVDWLQAGEVITPEDLDAAVERQGVEIQSGDILFFRTGWRTKFKQEQDAGRVHGRRARHRHRLRRLAARARRRRDRVRQLGDRGAAGRGRRQLFNVHMVLIRDMGMTLGEILDLDELADDCASDGMYEFFCTAPADQVHQRRRVADQPARHQVGGEWTSRSAARAGGVPRRARRLHREGDQAARGAGRQHPVLRPPSGGRPHRLGSRRPARTRSGRSCSARPSGCADEAGHYRYAFPKEYGGKDGTNLGMAVIREHLAAKGLGLHNDLQNEHSIVGNNVGLLLMIEYGTEEQKAEWVDDLAARAAGLRVRDHRAAARLGRDVDGDPRRA